MTTINSSNTIHHPPSTVYRITTVGRRSFAVRFLFLLFLAGCQTVAQSPQNQQKPQEIIPVKVESLSSEDGVIPIISSGVVAAQEEVKLSFKIGGIISAVYVQEGQQVKKGQLLARLDPAEINAQLSQAKIALEKSERDLNRVQQLYEDTVATLEQVQDLTTAKKVAEENLKIASFNQQHATIYAPVSGRVLKRFAEKGEVIGPGNPVFFLAATNTAQVVRISLADVDLVKVQMGDKAKVSFDAWPGQTFDASVNEIAAGANPMTATFDVELKISGAPTSLRNGFIGKVSLFPSSQASRVKIPITAVVEADAETAMIYIPGEDGQSFEPLRLKHYEIGNGFITISPDQVKGITQLITDGARYLKPDSRISIIHPRPQTISAK